MVDHGEEAGEGETDGGGGGDADGGFAARALEVRDEGLEAFEDRVEREEGEGVRSESGLGRIGEEGREDVAKDGGRRENRFGETDRSPGFGGRSLEKEEAAAGSGGIGGVASAGREVSNRRKAAVQNVVAHEWRLSTRRSGIRSEGLTLGELEAGLHWPPTFAMPS